MVYKLEYSKVVQNEFDEIYRSYLETFSNEQAALKVIRSIQKSVDLVLLDPDGALSFDARIGTHLNKKHEIRFTISEQYLIFFIIVKVEKIVYIVHILSTRIDYLNHLKLLFKNFEERELKTK